MQSIWPLNTPYHLVLGRGHTKTASSVMGRRAAMHRGVVARGAINGCTVGTLHDFFHDGKGALQTQDLRLRLPERILKVRLPADLLLQFGAQAVAAFGVGHLSLRAGRARRREVAPPVVGMIAPSAF